MKYKLITNDTHLEVSVEQWRHRIPAKYQDEGPRVVDLEGGGQGWVIKGAKQPLPIGMNLCSGKDPTQWQDAGFHYRDNHAGAGDAAQRVREMETDGVIAEIEYPAVGGPSFYAQAAEVDPDLYLATVETYNDFLSDFCMYAPNQLLGMGMVPVTGIEDAVAELKRTRKHPGLKGWALHKFPAGKDYATPEDDLFWAEAIKLNAPITAHGNFGGGMVTDPDMARKFNGNAAPLQYLISAGSKAPAYTVCQLICKGVFDRFPELKLHFAETGMGWVPYFLEQADDRFMRHKYAEKQIDPDFVEPKLLPSEYFHRHILLGFQIDYHGLDARHVIGLKNIAWGNDFPHAVSDWPNSQRIVNEQFKHIPQEEADLILWKNVADYYHLEAA